MEGVKLSMTLFIDTECNRVLFADPNKDCLDFLFELLSLPLSTVNGLLREHCQMSGSLENLYKNIQNLNAECTLPGQSRKILLEPIRPPHSATSFHTQQIFGTPPDQKLYWCTNCNRDHISNQSSDVCPNCNLQMTLVKAYGAPPLEQALNRGGSANGMVTYVITDGLVVEPLSTSSTEGITTLLKKMNVRNLNTVEERVVNLTNNEAVMLLKARLSTDEALTEVFLKGQQQAMVQDMGMFTVAQTIGDVLCCKCGILMQPNAANMCAKCLQSEVDITERLRTHFNIMHCPECVSYLHPPSTWIKAQLESKELLKECVERFKRVNKVSLTHAAFIWTEPHSKRIKVKLRLQKEVLNGAVLEQGCIVDYVVQEQMCRSCSRVQANPDQWVAVVQVRQHVSHRRTFFYLEQLILKHDAAKDAIRIKQMNHGIDFFFNNRSHGEKFSNFLRSLAPTKKTTYAKQLVSQDRKSNNNIYKYTISVEISPICRDDLVCLPLGVALSLGNLGPLVICNKVRNKIALLDPFALRQSFLNADQISFKALLSCRQLVKYIVLDVEAVSSEVNVGGLGYVLADAQVARVSDFGKNNMIFSVRTHLGHLLTPGAYALGYDLHGANYNDIELDKYSGLVLPHAVLIKKSYEEESRNWGKPCSRELKSLNMEIDSTVKGKDDENLEYELFLRDLEENPDSVFNLSLNSNGEIQPLKMAPTTNGEDVSLTLVDEFEDLDLYDAEDRVDIMEE